MEPKRVGLTSIDAHLGDITFSLTGPPDQIKAVVAFIRNLVRHSIKFGGINI